MCPAAARAKASPTNGNLALLRKVPMLVTAGECEVSSQICAARRPVALTRRVRTGDGRRDRTRRHEESGQEANAKEG